MTYEFTKNAPPILDEKNYYKIATNDFNKLLEEHSDDEKKLQRFFELNPCFVPGARDELSGAGPSGHGPYLEVLISQPKFSGLFDRMPDFMWLASDSVYFTPVIIEIEAPSKKYFNKDGSPTKSFTHAKNQLDEWQTILSRPENILKFYQDFSIPDDLTDLTFKPFFLLIYGRRSEYKRDNQLKQKRGHLMGREQMLMSFDRISPVTANRNYVCCNVKNGKYYAKNLAPTFRLGPYEDHLLELRELVEAVDNTAYINEERKAFLKEKIPYCLKFYEAEKNGVQVMIRNENDFQMYE